MVFLPTMSNSTQFCLQYEGDFAPCPHLAPFEKGGQDLPKLSKKICLRKEYIFNRDGEDLTENF